MELVLEARNTHLYPGLEGSVDGMATLPSGKGDVNSRISFSDGSVALATLRRRADGAWRLATGPYRTAAGTDIGERKWDVVLIDEGGRTRFRIRKKLAD